MSDAPNDDIPTGYALWAVPRRPAKGLPAIQAAPPARNRRPGDLVPAGFGSAPSIAGPMGAGARARSAP